MVIVIHIYLQYYYILFFFIQINIIRKYLLKKACYAVNKEVLLCKYIDKSHDKSNDESSNESSDESSDEFSYEANYKS